MFDGVSDGFYLDHDPLANWTEFTAEIYFQPHSDGNVTARARAGVVVWWCGG